MFFFIFRQPILKYNQPTNQPISKKLTIYIQYQSCSASLKIINCIKFTAYVNNMLFFFLNTPMSNKVSNKDLKLSASLRPSLLVHLRSQSSKQGSSGVFFAASKVHAEGMFSSPNTVKY